MHPCDRLDRYGVFMKPTYPLSMSSKHKLDANTQTGKNNYPSAFYPFPLLMTHAFEIVV
jgi:hypothetical protein